MKFIDVLDSFKKAEGESAENVMPVTEDDSLRNGLLAWQSMVVDYDAEKECPHEEPKKQWEWLWKNIDFNMNDYSIIMGSNIYDVEPIFFRLKALKLIYPDGTINKLTKAYMRNMIMKKLPKKDDKTKKEDKSKADNDD